MDCRDPTVTSRQPPPQQQPRCPCLQQDTLRSRREEQQHDVKETGKKRQKILTAILSVPGALQHHENITQSYRSLEHCNATRTSHNLTAAWNTATPRGTDDGLRQHTRIYRSSTKEANRHELQPHVFSPKIYQNQYSSLQQRERYDFDAKKNSCTNK